MATITSQQQLNQLATELANILGISYGEAVSRLNQALLANNIAFVIPFNTDAMDLEVKTGAASGVPQLSRASGTQSAVQAIITSAGADNTTIYTVTAGKTFYCTGISLNNEAGATQTMSIKDDTVVVFSHRLETLKSAIAASTTPIFVAAASSVIALGNPSTAGTASIWGWEE